MKSFYITTPIYYINARPHIGHAYTTMVADAIARAHRALGKDVFFLTGTDEHGQKVERAAQKAGKAPQQFADEVAEAFRAMCADLNISNSDFIRTTEPRHHRAAQALWERVRANGDIYKGEYEGWYCTVDEVFVPEKQLVDGRCPTCGGAVERLKEESYYFRLSKYQQPLLDLYRSRPDFLQPEIRMNEIRSFVEGGLEDLSISRASFQWGVPVPGDPAHVMYVWFDALTNYLTALGFGSDDASRMDRYWPTATHLMGKEIIRQHALYWPAFLMSAGLPLPKRIVAHGHWMMAGAKMSKSIGNVARYQDYTAVFGVDALRYFVMREMPLGQDANFGDEGVLNRYNADLANDLGNLVSRAMTMVHRYCDGVVPEARLVDRQKPEVALQDAIDQTVREATHDFERYQISLALQNIWALIGQANRYIVEREPWKLARQPDQRPLLDASLYHVASAVRVIAELIDPVMPDTATRMRRMLGVTPQQWTGLLEQPLTSGTRLGPTEPLFPRVEKTVEELRAMSDSQTDSDRGTPAEPGATQAVGAGTTPAALQQAQDVPSLAGVEDTRISIDDFMKVELRVAKVLEAEAVPKSKKLVKLKIDVGTDQRTIVAGIAEAYQPEQLVGRTVVIVFNLKPAKLMGIESNGMVLAASPEGGKPILVAFDQDVPPGARVR